MDAGELDTSGDARFLDRIAIPGLRRAGDFQTAAAMARGDVVVHGASAGFRVTGVRGERARLSPKEIAELAVT